jgi:hypothetical protein
MDCAQPERSTPPQGPGGVRTRRKSAQRSGHETPRVWTFVKDDEHAAHSLKASSLNRGGAELGECCSGTSRPAAVLAVSRLRTATSPHGSVSWKVSEPPACRGHEPQPFTHPAQRRSPFGTEASGTAAIRSIAPSVRLSVAHRRRLAREVPDRGSPRLKASRADPSAPLLDVITLGVLGVLLDRRSIRSVGTATTAHLLGGRCLRVLD